METLQTLKVSIVLHPENENGTRNQNYRVSNRIVLPVRHKKHNDGRCGKALVYVEKNFVPAFP